MKITSVLLASVFLIPSLARGAEAPPAGTAMLWRQPPGTPQTLDLFWGAGSEAGKPVGPFTFEKSDPKGTNPKVWVVDQRGVRWGVKFGDEANSDVAASRLMWAAGYRTAEVYFVPEGVIQGGKDLGLAAKHIDASGKFKNGRFQKNLQEPGVAKVEDHYIPWGWDKNPFVGTKEYSGLLLMNVLMANFDTKESNNKIQTLTYQDGRIENWYMVSDIGGTFGKSNAIGSHKWNLKNYAQEKFVEGTTKEGVNLFFEGRYPKNFRTIPLDQARWIYSVIGGLTRAQIEDAFRAAYTDVRVKPLPNPEDEATVQGFAEAFEKRLSALSQATK